MWCLFKTEETEMRLDKMKSQVTLELSTVRTLENAFRLLSYEDFTSSTTILCDFRTRQSICPVVLSHWVCILIH